MEPPASLRASFLRHAPAAADVAALGERLDALYRRGAEARPAIVLPAVTFAAHLGQLVAASSLATLDHLAVEDVYLACACAAGDRAALQELDREFLPRVASAIARVGRTPDFIAEATQQLRVKLLVPSGAKPAGILAYGGRGPLGAWLRVAAVRTATDIVRQTPQHDTFETNAGGAATGRAGNPEVLFLKAEGADEIEAALERTLDGMSDRDRTLLRLYFVERMSLAKLGKIYHLHETTMLRRLTALREGLLAQIKGELDLDSAELASKFALVESRLDVHLERHLLPQK